MAGVIAMHREKGWLVLLLCTGRKDGWCYCYAQGERMAGVIAMHREKGWLVLQGVEETCLL